MDLSGKLVVVQILRERTGSKRWILYPLDHALELVNHDCSRLEKFVDYHHPGWVFVKWALVHDSFMDVMLNGLEEMEAFGASF